MVSPPFKLIALQRWGGMFSQMFVVILLLMLINVHFDSDRVLIYHYYRIYSLRHVSFAVSQYLWKYYQYSRRYQYTSFRIRPRMFCNLHVSSDRLRHVPSLTLRHATPSLYCACLLTHYVIHPSTTHVFLNPLTPMPLPHFYCGCQRVATCRLCFLD